MEMEALSYIFLNQLKGFSKLDYKKRLQKLKELSFLDDQDISYLQSHRFPPLDLAENFIENALGYFPIPLGVAVNFVINKKKYVLPLAVEETSIIAAASKTARWISQQGEIKTKTLSHLSTGQIQIAKVKNLSKLEASIKKHFETWKKEINQGLLFSMSQRGGGLKSWELRSIDRFNSGKMAVVHLYIETCDAMGANLINQVCEYLKNPLEECSGEKVNLCILSNLADKRMIQADIVVKHKDLNLLKKIEEASFFAELDPYRASTSNKGILNGMDALLIATGNDWRAVESGLHAYAASQGTYKSLSTWRVQNGVLHGTMKAPCMVGTVGGMTSLHPTAKLSLKILGFPNAEELAGICCALGLVQNLAALKALVTEGVIEGHMKLHIKNLMVQLKVKKKERVLAESYFTQFLKKKKYLSFSQSAKILEHWRTTKKWPHF